MPDVVRNLAALHDLVDESIDLIRRVSGIDYDYYLENVPYLLRALEFGNFTAAAQEASQNITVGVLRDVGFWARQLDSHFADTRVGDDELRDLYADVTALFETVSSSGIDADLRQAILERIEAIRRAITEYRIHGTKGLRDELHATLGVLLRRSSELQSKGNEKWTTKMWAFLVKADGIVERGQKYGPLLQAAAIKLLGTNLLG